MTLAYSSRVTSDPMKSIASPRCEILQGFSWISAILLGYSLLLRGRRVMRFIFWAPLYRRLQIQSPIEILFQEWMEFLLASKNSLYLRRQLGILAASRLVPFQSRLVFLADFVSGFFRSGFLLNHLWKKNGMI